MRSAGRPRQLRVAAVFLLLVSCFAPRLTGQSPDLRHVLLTLAKKADPDFHEGRVRADLDVFQLELGRRLKALSRPEDRARALARYFFQEKLFSSSPDLASPEAFYLGNVLASREGYCLSLSAMILSVARRLDLPVHLVAVPRHVFLRWEEGGRHFNIETTEGGRLRSDDFYAKRVTTSRARDSGAYLAALDDRAVVAHLLNNEGFILWHAGRNGAAETRFLAALELWPHLAEAMLNLGIIHGERGEQDTAQKWFEKAAKYLGDDAALSWNRALAGLKGGDYEKTLRILDALADSKGAGSDYSALLMATLMRPRHWKALQARVDAEGRRLEKAGRFGAGWRATYRSLSDPRAIVTRTEPRIRGRWRWSPPARGIPARGFVGDWRGWIRLREGGHLTFMVVFEQGFRLWVDGVRILDESPRRKDKFAHETLLLEPGWHRVRVEYLGRQVPNGLIVSIKRAEADRPLEDSRVHHIR